MRVVNLARRPFVNRRPIFRFALLLWVIGVVLLAVNTHLYYRHWQGSAEIRQQLAEVESALIAQEEIVAGERQRLERINLDALNARVAFLNALISYRTFPWSALFDDLEEVMPANVRLVDVQPLVRLASDFERLERRRSRPPRVAAGSAQRQRLAQRAREGSQAEPDEPQAIDEQEPPVAPDTPRASDSRTGDSDEALAPDEVLLRLTGFAEKEELILELVDALYADPSFRRPLLGSESLDREQGPQASSFNLSVVYLTRVPDPATEPLVAGAVDPSASAGLTPGASVPSTSGGTSGSRTGRSGAAAAGSQGQPGTAQGRNPAAEQRPRSSAAPGVATPPSGSATSAAGPSPAGGTVSVLTPPNVAPELSAEEQRSSRRDAREEEESDAPELREPDASDSPELDRGALLTGRDAFGRLAAVLPATRSRA